MAVVAQHLLLNVDSTITITTKTRPSAATVTIYDHNGAKIIEDQAATVDSVNTTLSSAANRNATSLSVASAAGITSETEYFLAGRNSETVDVEYVDGTTVYLRYPLFYNHANGDTFKGHTVSYTVSGSDITYAFFNGRAEWKFDGTLHASTTVECTEYKPRSLVTLSDLRKENPDITLHLRNNADINGLIDQAYDEVIQRIAKIGSYSTYVDSGRAIKNAVVKQFMLNIYRRQGTEDSTVLYDRYATLVTQAIDSFMAIVARDADQDGAIEENERLILNTVFFSR